MNKEQTQGQNPPQGPANLAPVSKRQRKPKEGNSELFNEVLSATNALSVTEKTRLVKSLAGQLGFVVVGAQDLLDKKQNASETEKKETRVPKVLVRPNPLKGTKFEREKIDAYNALVAAKQASPATQLPADHAALARYKQALEAYKEAHKSLTPLAPPGNQGVQEKKKKRTVTERSPEPKAKSTTQRLRSMVGLSSGSSSAKKGEMDVEL